MRHLDILLAGLFYIENEIIAEDRPTSTPSTLCCLLGLSSTVGVVEAVVVIELALTFPLRGHFEKIPGLQAAGFHLL